MYLAYGAGHRGRSGRDCELSRQLSCFRHKCRARSSPGPRPALGCPKRDLADPRGIGRGFTFVKGRLMYKQKYLHLFAALLAFAGLVVVDARGAELEGALQYPPPSVGQDAQPPPPARMVPQPVSPRRIEMGVSGSSRAPDKPILIHPSVPSHGLGTSAPSSSDGN